MTVSTTPGLELRGIELHYGFVKALDGIDFAVHPGEVVALLGDNGAGKSTLLKVMSAAHRPRPGRSWSAGARSTSTSRATPRRPVCRWSTRTSPSSTPPTSPPT